MSVERWIGFELSTDRTFVAGQLRFWDQLMLRYSGREIDKARFSSGRSHIG